MNKEDGQPPEFCLGKESPGASNYAELLTHADHKLEVRAFPRGPEILKVALECLTCNRVLIEYDNPDYESSGAD